MSKSLPLTNDSPVTAIPRLALSYREAAEAIGVSVKHFERHVLPKLRVSMSGGRRLVAVRELERYLEATAV